jgi:uncharacterized protein YciI
MTGFVFRLIPPRPDFATTMTGDEKATMAVHFAYWSGLTEQGKVLAFGPVDDPSGHYGIGIVTAEDMNDAASIRDGDPAMTSSLGFRTEIAAMFSLVTRDGRFDAM